jgi:hypothetical protein
MDLKALEPHDPKVMVTDATHSSTLGCAFLQDSPEFLQERHSCKYFSGITFLQNTGMTHIRHTDRTGT